MSMYFLSYFTVTETEPGIGVSRYPHSCNPRISRPSQTCFGLIPFSTLDPETLFPQEKDELILWRKRFDCTLKMALLDPPPAPFSLDNTHLSSGRYHQPRGPRFPTDNQTRPSLLFLLLCPQVSSRVLFSLTRLS